MKNGRMSSLPKSRIKQGGSDEEKQDMRAALDLLGVTNEEDII